MLQASMVVVVFSTIQFEDRVYGIAWRETASRLMLRVRFSGGTTATRALDGCRFGHLLADASTYSPRFAIQVPMLSEALDLIGMPLAAAESYTAAEVHFSWCCRLRQCPL